MAHVNTGVLLAEEETEKNSFELAGRLSGIGEYYFSQKLRQIDEMNRQGKNVINLGIGSPDLPPHPDVIKVLQEESSKPNVHAYQSYKGSPVLRKAISEWYNKWYGVSLNAESEILPLIGSKEGIMHICMTYLDEHSVALVPNPGYPTYNSAVRLSGATPETYSLLEANNWQPDFEELDDLIRKYTVTGEKTVRTIFVNYPQMPTGQLPSDELFTRLIDWATRNKVFIVHDNPYSFILNDHPKSMLQYPGAKEVVLELNSLSKSHNMAGWRIGMLCGAKERINEVMRFKSNMDSGMFLPLQLAAAKSLELGKDWFDALNATYAERRNKVFAMLDLLHCSFSKEQVGMFVWAKIPAAYPDGYHLSDKILNNASVFLTPGGIFGSAGENYIRISLCTPLEKIEEATKRIVEKGL